MGGGELCPHSMLKWASLHFLAPGRLPFISQIEQRHFLDQVLQSWGPRDHRRMPRRQSHPSCPDSCPPPPGPVHCHMSLFLGIREDGNRFSNFLELFLLLLLSFARLCAHPDGASKSVSDKRSWSHPQRLRCPLPQSRSSLSPYPSSAPAVHHFSSCAVLSPPATFSHTSPLLLQTLQIFLLFRQRRREGEREGEKCQFQIETSIGCLPYMAQPGTKPTT